MKLEAMIEKSTTYFNPLELPTRGTPTHCGQAAREPTLAA